MNKIMKLRIFNIFIISLVTCTVVFSSVIKAESKNDKCRYVQPGLLKIWETDSLVDYSITVKRCNVDSVIIPLPQSIVRWLKNRRQFKLNAIGIDLGTVIGVNGENENEFLLNFFNQPLDTIINTNAISDVQFVINGKYFKEIRNKQFDISVYFLGFPLDCKERVDSCLRAVRYVSGEVSRPLFNIEEE